MMAGLLKSDEAAAAVAAGDLDLAASLGVPQLNVRYDSLRLCTIGHLQSFLRHCNFF